MIYKTLHRENEHHEFTNTGGELVCGNGEQFALH
jgi:hypothetical protein